MVSSPAGCLINVFVDSWTSSSVVASAFEVVAISNYDTQPKKSQFDPEGWTLEGTGEIMRKQLRGTVDAEG